MATKNLPHQALAEILRKKQDEPLRQVKILEKMELRPEIVCRGMSPDSLRSFLNKMFSVARFGEPDLSCFEELRQVERIISNPDLHVPESEFPIFVRNIIILAHSKIRNSAIGR